MSENQMNELLKRTVSMELTAKIFRGGNFIMLPFDIEKIASIVARGKGVLVWYRWDYQEWDQPMPKILGSSKPYHHSVVAVDFTLYEGKKALIIDDSWGKNRGMNGQRILTEDWIRERMTFAAYYEDLSNVETLNTELTQKPHYAFTRELRVGMQGGDIAQLRRCLGYLKDAEGYLFPLTQEPTGYYGGITAKAVRRYQMMKGLPQTGMVDISTLKQLNEEFKP